MILPEKLLVSVAVCMCAASAALALNRDFGAEKLSAYIDKFNADDDELYVNSIPNSEAKKFLAENVPTLDTPDEAIDATYYFRWWTFRKHIVKTPEGYVITEFMPKVSWAGKYNTIVCPAAHHIREARWLADGKIAADYAKFWSTAPTQGRTRSGMRTLCSPCTPPAPTAPCSKPSIPRSKQTMPLGRSRTATP